MFKKIFSYTVAGALAMAMTHSTVAQTTQSNESDMASQEEQVFPFTQYTKLIDGSDGVLVYGNSASLFTPYSGPALSTDPADEIQRKRYGTLQLSSSLSVYLDYVSDPMGGTYEFIEVKNNQVIGKLEDPYNIISAIYINGLGNLYVYSNPSGMCWGKASSKYELKNNALVEVAQPFYYTNVKSTPIQNVDLLLAPQANSPKVASLQADTSASIIGVNYDKDNGTPWFLVKTPLGLTGWANSSNGESMVFNITQCN